MPLGNKNRVNIILVKENRTDTLTLEVQKRIVFVTKEGGEELVLIKT